MTESRHVPIQESVPDGGFHEGSKEFLGNNSNVTPPASIYESMNRHPYSMDYFGIKTFTDFDDKLAFPELMDKGRTVDKYINKQIGKRGYNDDLNSYEDILQELMDAIGIREHEQSSIKFDKIVRYIQLLSKTPGGRISKKSLKNFQ